MMFALARGNALDVGTPLAGDFEAALHGFGARVHRQHHVFAAQLGKRGAERTETVGMERTADQRDGVELGVGRRGDLGVAVTEVDRRIGGQAIQVAPAVDIGDPRTLGACRHHGQRRIVMRRMPFHQVRWRPRFFGPGRASRMVMETPPMCST